MKKVINPEAIRNIRDAALQTYHKKLSEEWQDYRIKMSFIYTDSPNMHPPDAVVAAKTLQKLKDFLPYQRTLIKYLCDQIRALNTPESYSTINNQNTSYIMICYDDIVAMADTLDELCEDDITVLSSNDERDKLAKAASNIAFIIDSIGIYGKDEVKVWKQSALKYSRWLTSEEENSED